MSKYVRLIKEVYILYVGTHTIYRLVLVCADQLVTVDERSPNPAILTRMSPNSAIKKN